MIPTLVVLLWAPLLALALLVLVSYYQAWRHAPPGRQGLLPVHVAVVTASYLTLATRDAYEVATDDSDPWNVAVVIFSLVTGLAAMVLILRFERLRMPMRREPD